MKDFNSNATLRFITILALLRNINQAEFSNVSQMDVGKRCFKNTRITHVPCTTCSFGCVPFEATKVSKRSIDKEISLVLDLAVKQSNIILFDYNEKLQGKERITNEINKMLRGYEGVRYVSDKQMIVFDIGSAYTKFGYAGEASPRGIIRTEVRCPESKKIRRIIDHTDVEDLYQLLVEFLHLLFFKYVVVTPKDTRILFLESPLAVTSFRDTIAKVMFKHFEVGSILFLPSHLATISTLGIDTALVLDVGYREATLIPIFEGIPVLKAWQALPLAGQVVHENLRRYFNDISSDIDLSEKVLEDIKVRTCFTTTLERSTKLGTKDAPTSPPDVMYPGVKRILIPGEIREKAFEILWERDNDNLSLPTMILDAIVKCPLDMRRVLVENIILIGGTTMTKGFASRLKSELLTLVQGDLYKSKLKIQSFKFHTAPSKPNYTAWLGGAIFGTTDLPLRCLTKETYLKTNRVPDWSCLIDNQKDETSYEI